MAIGDIVHFQNQNFFNGAVQLGWVRQQPALAAEVASAFVFHGPRYHGHDAIDQPDLSGAYRLKDTATFLVDLLRTIDAAHRGEETNPFWLAIAGYGAGKSHLSVALSELMSSPNSALAQQILTNLESADAALAREARTLIEKTEQPILVIPLDGSGRFHLGNMLNQTVFSQLEKAGADLGPVQALSPRFAIAEHFVERNYSIRRDEFLKRLPGQDAETICEALRFQDEATFDVVNAIHMDANGHLIPMEGQESGQAVLATLATEYCGDGRPFSHVVVLFDELGLFLEHAAEGTEKAGARSLQEIFQGVQDNFSRIQFVGFIQYELKTYLQRFGTTDLLHLQRYLTRFDVAEKLHLSSNLETLFAHMIHKDESALDAVWDQGDGNRRTHETWQQLSMLLPSFGANPTWADEESFSRLIARGCWPLHPLAVWLLTRQSDLIQQRSALSFVNEIIAKHAASPALTGGKLKQISAAELLHDFLLEQFAMANQAAGGLIEILLQLLDQRAAWLDETMRIVMSGVAVLDKVRIGRQPRETVDVMLTEATALPLDTLRDTLGALSNLGLLEWNADLGQYELLAEGASRGQFQKWLRGESQAITSEEIHQLFLRRGISDCGLSPTIDTDFGERRDIRTQDWRFEVLAAHMGTVSQAINQAFQELPKATLPESPKGRAFYLFLDARQDLLEADTLIRNTCNNALSAINHDVSPVWIIALHDRKGVMADSLARISAMEERATESEKERFRRFINDELEAARKTLADATDDAIRERHYWVAGMDNPPTQRLLVAGREIFSHIYPETTPFPFDGFASSGGKNGPKNVTDLSRALVTHQVNQVWIQAQASQLRNRIFAVLHDSWRALDEQLEPREPAKLQLRSIFTELQQSHQDDPDRQLSASFRWLIAAPRGMNSASATLLISLLIGLRTPQRQLFLDGKPVSNADWINLAIPNRARYFDEKILRSTTIRFFDEDSEARWTKLLNSLEQETRLDKIIERSNEIANYKSVEPTPPSLVERQLRLEAVAEEARTKYLAMKNNLGNGERQLENAIQRSSVHHCLEYGFRFTQAREELLDDERWPPKLLHECDQLIRIANEVISQELADSWVERQTVRDVTETQRFRDRTEKEARWLETLGYRDYAHRLQQQAQHALYTVEERQRHALTLGRAEDYPRQSPPRGSEPILVLRDELRKGQDLIGAIQGIVTLSETEKAAHVGVIERRVSEVQKTISEQEEQLDEIYALSIESEEEVREASAKVERLRTIFNGDRSEPAINELAIQLDHIQQDIQAWEQGDLPAERLEEVLRSLAERQIEEFEEFADPKWDLQVLYDHMIEAKVSAVRQRSKEWMHSRLHLEAEIPGLNIERVRHLKSELDNPPVYISAAERVVLERLVDTLERRQGELEEEDRKARIEAWKGGFPGHTAIATLTRAEVERFLSSLESPSIPLSEDLLKWRDELTNRLSERLDEISLDDLVRRIERLSPTLRAQLLKRLSAVE